MTQKKYHFGHASDCATNNAPALPVGTCDCSVLAPKDIEIFRDQIRRYAELLPAGLERSRAQYLVCLFEALEKISAEGAEEPNESHWDAFNYGDTWSAGIAMGYFGCGKIARNALAGLCVESVRE